MTEKPILFSDPMVRAILAGTKTQTRRVIAGPNAHVLSKADLLRMQDGYPDGTRPVFELGDEPFSVRCPFGQPGDRLWVREAFALSQRDPEDTDVSAREPQWWDPPVYRADGDLGGEWTRFDGVQHVPIRPPWRSARYMPRWASRLTLEVTSVRVECVQSISEEDARAEGCSGRDPEPAAEGGTIYAMKGRSSEPSPRAHFMHLWDLINGKREGCSWSANPWVWCVSFKVVPRG